MHKNDVSATTHLCTYVRTYVAQPRLTRLLGDSLVMATDIRVADSLSVADSLDGRKNLTADVGEPTVERQNQ